MRSPNPLELDLLPPGLAVSAICGRFPWTRKHRKFLEEAIDWQQAANPRPNFYFRWHLPRLVATLELLSSALAEREVTAVLDLACFPPYSLILERWIRQRSPASELVRTSLQGGLETYEVAGEESTVELQAVDLTPDPLPFSDEQFDLVMFMETIEHLYHHPQYTLLELNRILKPGGAVLISTPNVTSWKKIKGMTDGNFQFDSGTYGQGWGHRFEFSPFQLRSMLRGSGFRAQKEIYRDVYFDDPKGMVSAAQFWTLVASKFATGEFRSAGKLYIQSGSGMFFLWRKEESATVSPEDFVII